MLACLVFNPGRLDKLLGVTDEKWKGVAEELAAETTHALGKLVFGCELHAVAAEVADSMASEYARHIVESNEEISASDIKAAVGECLLKVKEVAGIDRVPERRQVVIVLTQ